MTVIHVSLLHFGILYGKFWEVKFYSLQLITHNVMDKLSVLTRLFNNYYVLVLGLIKIGWKKFHMLSLLSTLLYPTAQGSLLLSYAMANQLLV